MDLSQIRNLDNIPNPYEYKYFIHTQNVMKIVSHFIDYPDTKFFIKNFYIEDGEIECRWNKNYTFIKYPNKQILTDYSDSVILDEYGELGKVAFRIYNKNHIDANDFYSLSGIKRFFHKYKYETIEYKKLPLFYQSQLIVEKLRENELCNVFKSIFPDEISCLIAKKEIELILEENPYSSIEKFEKNLPIFYNKNVIHSKTVFGGDTIFCNTRIFLSRIQNQILTKYGNDFRVSKLSEFFMCPMKIDEYDEMLDDIGADDHTPTKFHYICMMGEVLYDLLDMFYKMGFDDTEIINICRDLLSDEAYIFFDEDEYDYKIVSVIKNFKECEFEDDTDKVKLLMWFNDDIICPLSLKKCFYNLYENQIINNRICEKIEECLGCGEMIIPDENDCDECGSCESLCKDCCYCSKFCCGMCNETYNRDEIESVFIDADDEYFCINCADENTISCMDCDLRLRKDDIDENGLCIDCRD